MPLVGFVLISSGNILYGKQTVGQENERSCKSDVADLLVFHFCLRYTIQDKWVACIRRITFWGCSMSFLKLKKNKQFLGIVS